MTKPGFLGRYDGLLTWALLKNARLWNYYKMATPVPAYASCNTAAYNLSMNLVGYGMTVYIQCHGYVILKLKLPGPGTVVETSAFEAF